MKAYLIQNLNQYLKKIDLLELFIFYIILKNEL